MKGLRHLRGCLISIAFNHAPKILPACLILASALCGSADNTLRGKRLHPRTAPLSQVSATTTARTDTLRQPTSGQVELSGYDKPLRSAYESFLLTNLTPRTLRALCVTLDYYDMEGRQLHQRCDTLPVSVPQGETRLVRLSTWDTQRSYYYHLGRRPLTPRVTPYSIKARVDFVTLAPEATPASHP